MRLADGRTFASGMRTVIANPGSSMLVDGTFIEFTVDLATFTVTNYTLVGSGVRKSLLPAGQRAVFFAEERPLHGDTLTGPLNLQVQAENLVMDRSGTVQNMKIQAKDCDQGGLFQIEPEPGTQYRYVLGAGFVHCVDPLDRVLITRDGQFVITEDSLVARESPEAATLAALARTNSLWTVAAGGRMGFVLGEDAGQPITLTQPEFNCTPARSPSAWVALSRWAASAAAGSRARRLAATGQSAWP